jgi:hypothetical protein
MGVARQLVALAHPAGADLACKLGLPFAELFTNPAARGIAEAIEAGEGVYESVPLPAGAHADARELFKAMAVIDTLDPGWARHLVRIALEARIVALLKQHAGELLQAPDELVVAHFNETAYIAAAAGALDLDRLAAIAREVRA